MNKAILSGLSLAMMFTGSAFAQSSTTTSTSESKMKIEDAADKKNKVEGDIDQEITNARMRAESGSKSKFSLSADLAYTGGALEKPFGVRRPVLSGQPGEQAQSSADVGLDARYRFTKNDSMTLGTSFGIMTPLQGDLSNTENQLNVFDPSLGYNRTGKIGSLQTSFSGIVSAGTSNESKSISKDGSFYLSANVLHMWQSGFTLGTTVAATYLVYGNGPGDATESGRTAVPGYYGGDLRSQYRLNIYPYLEYAFNDRYQFRTLFGYFNWHHLYGDPQSGRLLQTFVYQSVGLGIALSRDIYLYPNIQFVPDNIRDDFTNVALSATINMF